MVTVTLEMGIITQGRASLQAAAACHPPSLSAGAGATAPHALLHLACRPHLVTLCPVPVLLPRWLWGDGGGAGQGRVRTLGAPIRFQWSLLQGMALGGWAACQWELCAGHERAAGGMGPLGWVGCAPPVSGQAEKAEGSPKSSALPEFLSGSNS